MALRSCPGCGGHIHVRARTCVHCGANPLGHRGYRVASAVLLYGVGIALVALLGFALLSWSQLVTIP